MRKLFVIFCLLVLTGVCFADFFFGNASANRRSRAVAPPAAPAPPTVIAYPVAGKLKPVGLAKGEATGKEKELETLKPPAPPPPEYGIVLLPPPPTTK